MKPRISPHKSSGFPRNYRYLLALISAAYVTANGIASASTVTWDANTTTTGAQDGAGSWTTSGTNWWIGTANTTLGTSDTAVFGAGGTAGTVTVDSNVTVGNLSFSGTYTLGSITGTNTLTLGGSGGTGVGIIAMSIGGVTINSSIVNSGTLIIGSATSSDYNGLTLTGTNAGLTGSAIIGGTGAGGTGNVLLDLKNSNALASTSSVTVNNGSTLRLDQPLSGAGIYTISNLTISGTGMGGRGALSFYANNGSLSGTITLAGTTNVIQQQVGNFTLNSTIKETGGARNLTYQQLSQTGTLALTGSNSYTGSTTFSTSVSAYTIGVNKDAVFGAAPTSATNNLSFVGTSTAYYETLRADASFAINSNRNISVSTLAGFTFDTQGYTLTVGGVISGTVPIAKSGAGTLILAGANTFTGGLSVNAGSVQIGNGTSGSLAGGTLAIASTGTAVFNQANSTGFSGAITDNGVLKATSSSLNTLSGNISGTGSFSQEGSGTTVLSGNNTYSGATSVSNGVLTVNGTSSNSTVSVSNNATLSGSGVINGTTSVASGNISGNGLTLGTTTLNGNSTLSGHNIASSVTIAGGTTTLSGTTHSTSALSVSAGATLNANGTIEGSANVSGLLKGNSTVTGNLSLTSGTLSPGNSAGITTVSGNFIMDASSKLVAEVSGTVAGSSYDQLKVAGSVTLAGTLDLTTLSELTLGETITLIENTGNGTTTGYFSTIITSGSTYTVSTSGSTYTFTVGTTEYEINYAANTDSGSTYNDVSLTVVPEPGTWTLLVGGLGLLLGCQRLRQHKEI